MPTTRARRLRAAVVTAARAQRLRVAAIAGAALLAAGCTGSAAGSVVEEIRFQVVVPDGNIRAEGAPCAGARPYDWVHRGSPYTLEAADGTVLAEGALPTGHAVNADPGIDWEDTPQIPTLCVMQFTLERVPEHPSYLLRLEQGDPLEFNEEHIEAEEPVTFVVQ